MLTSSIQTDKLWKFIRLYIDPSYPLHSRIHPLNTFPQGACWFVKRDDDLSCGISGSKYRKYASLIPYIKQRGYKRIHLVGSSYSNHLVGLLQLLNEEELTPVVYMLGSPHQPLRGNYGLIRLLMGEREIHMVSREEWPHVGKIVEGNLCPSSFYLPEGGDCFPSLPGALSLAATIADQEQGMQITFDHLFVDAGTGLSAIALILGASFLQMDVTIHVVMMAGIQEEFHQKLHHYHALLRNVLPMNHPLIPYHLYPSSLAPSFGSTSKKVFDEMSYMAQKEGILCDPIYTAKLFYTAKKIHDQKNLQGNLLCIHSGGTLSVESMFMNDGL